MSNNCTGEQKSNYHLRKIKLKAIFALLHEFFSRQLAFGLYERKHSICVRLKLIKISDIRTVYCHNNL